MALNDVLKGMADKDGIVIPALTEYLARGKTELAYFSPETFQKISGAMTTPPRDRSRAFSGSATGSCLRRQVFGYIGVPQFMDLDLRKQLIFAQGNFIHLMLQGILLDAQIIYDIEFTALWRARQHRGSLDGVGNIWWPHAKYHGEEFILEIKGRNSYVYKSHVKSGAPEIAYKRQIAKYMVLTGIDLASLLYYNKDSQELHEWVYHRDDLKVWVDAAQQEIDQLWDYAAKQQLPPPLAGAASGIEPECKTCPYGGKDGPCLKVKTWKEAETWQP